jgi:hypothetical protein
VFENFWTPVGAGVKDQEEVDAMALYLFGYDEKGREMIREIDATVAEIPGLEGLTLVEDVLDAALERRRLQPGYAGAVPAPAPVESLRGARTEAWGEPREDAVTAA